MLAGEDHHNIIDLTLTVSSQKLFKLTNAEELLVLEPALLRVGTTTGIANILRVSHELHFWEPIIWRGGRRHDGSRSGPVASSGGLPMTDEGSGRRNPSCQL